MPLTTAERRDTKQFEKPQLKVRAWQRTINQTIAAELSLITRYCDRLIQWQPQDHDTMTLLQSTDCRNKSIAQTLDDIPDFKTESSEKAAIVLNGNFNYDLDIQNTLQTLQTKLSRNSRLLVVLYNPYLAWLYRLASSLGLREADEPCTFITEVALKQLAAISGYELVRLRPSCPCPFRLFGLGDLINRFVPLIPMIKWISLTCVAVLRPRISEATKPSLSIVIPARNEKGNIEGAITRLQYLKERGIDFEIIFVEGHSTDGTWEEIDRLVKARNGEQIRAYQQTGKGKSDAVRLGFKKATKDVLVILDADLSVPPELLIRFFDAYCQGHGDFINGSRLVYPIEGQAMKFLNKLGNAFFAKALSRVLGVNLSDSLCGTKLFSRDDYERMTAWRGDFGDFDPFGDFEMLFPAAQMALGIADIPIRYRDRLYGETNIRRFYHGLMLFKMTLIGLLKIALGRTP